MLLFTSGVYYIYTHRADLFPDLFERDLPVIAEVVANTEAYTKAAKGKNYKEKKNLFIPMKQK